jgi:hypothetical protein
MRRMLIVVGLVVLLAAAIVVPAVAQPSPDANNPVDRVLSALGVHPGTEKASEALRDLFGAPTANDVVISPIERNSSGEEDRGISSSSSSNPDSSNSSDLIVVDPNASDPEDPGVSQEFSERRIESGSASPSSSFSNSGDNVNACPTTQQVVNTGNVANQQGVTQYNSTDGDIDVTGSSINITSDQTVTCDQTLNQAAEAGQ